MGVPYGGKPQGGLIANGGESTCFGIDWASRGFLSKIIVVQTAGVPVDFTVELFNSQRGCLGESESDSEGPSKGKLPADLFVVSPILNGVAGKLKYFSEESTGGSGFVFVGQDADRLGKSRKIWIRITPGGSGAKEFAVTFDGETFGE